MTNCKTCGAPVNLAPDGDPRYEAPVNRFEWAVTLIERVYYMEGKDVEWRAAHMNAIARDVHNGASLAWARRMFPRDGRALAAGREAIAQRGQDRMDEIVRLGQEIEADTQE